MKFDELLTIIPKIERGLNAGKTHRQIAADLEAEAAEDKPAKKPKRKAPPAPKPAAAAPSTSLFEEDHHNG